MAQNKTKRLSARADTDLVKEVEAFVDAVPNIESTAQLIRIALKEYLDNHSGEAV